MKYCPECGTHLEQELDNVAAEVEVAEQVSSDAVRIAEIEADRDIQLAKIQAKAIETEAVVEAQVAEAKQEVLEDTLAAVTEPETVVQPSPEPVAVIVDDPGPEPDMDDVPPPPLVDENPAAEKPKAKKNPWVSQY